MGSIVFYRSFSSKVFDYFLFFSESVFNINKLEAFCSILAIEFYVSISRLCYLLSSTIYAIDSSNKLI